MYVCHCTKEIEIRPLLVYWRCDWVLKVIIVLFADCDLLKGYLIQKLAAFNFFSLLFSFKVMVFNFQQKMNHIVSYVVS